MRDAATGTIWSVWGSRWQEIKLLRIGTYCSYVMAASSLTVRSEVASEAEETRENITRGNAREEEDGQGRGGKRPELRTQGKTGKRMWAFGDSIILGG